MAKGVPKRNGSVRRAPTRTSSFGVSRREGHDSSGFYDRFEPPRLIEDDSIAECPVKDQLICADGRKIDALPDRCIALVVTSPPYFAGKEYEAELGENAGFRRRISNIWECFATSSPSAGECSNQVAASR